MKKAKNIWTQRSIELADQSDSLDQLFKIDPISQNAKRPISKKEEEEIDEAFHAKEEAGIKVIKALLKLKRFPLKDSYAAYLRKDPSSLKRNPQTVERIFGALNELGLKAVLANCEAPIEANRQNGPLFKNWIEKKSLGCEVCQTAKEFLEYPGNCVLSASDKEMGNFARECLGYQRKKGLDFCAKFNGVDRSQAAVAICRKRLDEAGAEYRLVDLSGGQPEKTSQRKGAIRLR